MRHYIFQIIYLFHGMLPALSSLVKFITPTDGIPDGVWQSPPLSPLTPFSKAIIILSYSRITFSPACEIIWLNRKTSPFSMFCREKFYPTFDLTYKILTLINCVEPIRSPSQCERTNYFPPHFVKEAVFISLIVIGIAKDTIGKNTNYASLIWSVSNSLTEHVTPFIPPDS